jgi:hypothetical protein
MLAARRHDYGRPVAAAGLRDRGAASHRLQVQCRPCSRRDGSTTGRCSARTPCCGGRVPEARGCAYFLSVAIRTPSSAMGEATAAFSRPTKMQ